MSLNRVDARDEITKLFDDAWTADPISTAVPIFYPDRDGEPPEDGSWVRFMIQHIDGQQGALANANGQRIWDAQGIVTVQIFTEAGSGLSISDKLAMIAQNAYRGKTTPNGVWFKNSTVNEIGKSGEFQQANMLVDFEYTEII